MENNPHLTQHGLLWKLGLNLLAIFYILAGVNHFANPEFYMKIMPPMLPWHLLLIQISGVIELALGIAVLIPRYRQLAAWGIILLLIAVFPANIYHAMIAHESTVAPPIAVYIRLPVQLLFIWWAWVYTKE
jgi:uncharacterized membrane protein